MKLNSKIHGAIDYLVVIFLWLSPTLFSLPSVSSAFAYGIGVVHLSLTLCTHYELGLVKFIQLKIHATVELIVSLLLVPVAFYLGSIEGDFVRNYYLGLAIAIFLVWLASDYTNKPEGTREIPYIGSSTDGGMI